jgi:hypothetical protein
MPPGKRIRNNNNNNTNNNMMYKLETCSETFKLMKALNAKKNTIKNNRNKKRIHEAFYFVCGWWGEGQTNLQSAPQRSPLHMRDKCRCKLGAETIAIELDPILPFLFLP